MSNEDRISRLPKSILIHILSFLPTKDSVKTSILSRTWRFTYISVPVLDLNDGWFEAQFRREKSQIANCKKSFKTFMYWFFNYRLQPCIRRLRLVLVNSYYTSDLDSWISAAVQQNVEEVDIPIIRGKLPQSLVNCSTLTVLKLQYYNTEQIIPKSVSMPNLKALHIFCEDRVRLCAACINMLVSGSPILQDLAIINERPEDFSTLFRNQQDVSILSPSLKSLVLRSLTDAICYAIVVDAPNLKFLDIRGKSLDIKFMNSSPVIEATIYLTGSCRPEVSPAIWRNPSCLWRISNVKVLSLSSFVLKASLDILEQIGFHNLTELVVDYCRDDLSILPRILKRLPSLQVLTLDEQHRRCGRCAHVVTSEAWKEQKFEMNCMKCFTFRGFRGSEGEMQIVEYFMENARALNEVRLFTNFMPKKELAFLQELLTLQRCSDAFKIIIS